MRIFVKAKPSASSERVEKIDETHYIVVVTEPPVQGRANSAIQKALANYLNVTPSQVRLVSGFSSRNKTFEIGS